MMHSRLNVLHRMAVSHLRVFYMEKLCLQSRYRLTFNVYSLSQGRFQQTFSHASKVAKYGKVHHSSECLFRRLPAKSVWENKLLYVPSAHQRRYISTVVLLFGKPFLKVTAMMVGRAVRKKYWALSPTERQLVKYTIQKNIHILSAVTIASAVLAFVYYTSHQEDTPITGRSRFMSFTQKQAVEISTFQAEFLVSFFKDQLFSADDARMQRAAKVATKVIDTNTEVKNVLKTWKIYVVDEKSVNAFVLPTGHIFVFNGILDLCTTDDQLAIILGHELAHAVLLHHVEGFSLSAFADWFLITGFALIWCFLRSDFLAIIGTLVFSKIVNVLVRLPSSRLQEWEADHVGLIFAANACYDVREAGVMWRNIAKQQESGSGVPIWMGTHPDSLKRAEFLDSLLKDAEGWRKANGCPPLAEVQKIS